MKHFLLFGTHPDLSLFEAECVLGKTRPLLSGSGALFDAESWNGAFLQDRLAGTVKLGDIIAAVPLSDLDAKQLADLIDERPRAPRILFGLTVQSGTAQARKQIKNLPIQLKRELQARGKSVRWITGDNGEIAPAAISKMHLDTEGYDFNIFIDKDTAYVGLTSHVQNIDAWSERDFGRPFRDAKTGMLPPKLARIMVNLGLQNQADMKILLDPFCGGGTVLMEAAMMEKELRIIGSDIDAKQISGSKRNIEWLIARGFLKKSDTERLSYFSLPAQHIDREVRNADVIVTEGYLGKPLNGHESLQGLETNKRDVERVWIETLPTLSKIQTAGARLICIWPSMRSSAGKVTVDPSKAAHDSGYTESARFSYARPDQNIIRNIVVLEKK